MIRPNAPAEIRDIRDEEISTFHQHGWVSLKNLISPETARLMLKRANEIFARAQGINPAGSGRLDDCWFTWANGFFQTGQMSSSPFREIAVSKEMGQIASKLIGRCRLTDEIIPIRSLGHSLFCKTGVGSPSSKQIHFHQDGASYDVDRAGLVSIWIALDTVTPDQGAMRFLDGSHSLGPLGDHRSSFPLQRYPKIHEMYELSPPLHYNMGDATAHDGFLLHGSPENSTDRSRWGYACLYIADDVKFDASATELKHPAGFAAPFEKYPIVYA